jgi:hypothetical protein
MYSMRAYFLEQCTYIQASVYGINISSNTSKASCLKAKFVSLIIHWKWLVLSCIVCSEKSFCNHRPQTNLFKYRNSHSLRKLTCFGWFYVMYHPKKVCICLLLLKKKVIMFVLNIVIPVPGTNTVCNIGNAATTRKFFWQIISPVCSLAVCAQKILFTLQCPRKL